MSSLRTQVAEDGRKVGVLTRDDIIEALREYAELYGDGFSQSAFNPASAKRNGRPELVEIYYKGRPDGRRWPSLNAIKSKFGGSWNDARAAAGFAPNSTGPASGRRSPGTAEPILNVRERLVYIPNEKTRELAHKITMLQERLRRFDDRLARQRERAERAERIVREMRARRDPIVREYVEPRPKRVVETRTKTKTITKTVKVKDTRALERLRSKLDDERAGRRAVEDQLRAEQRDRNREKSRFAAAETELVAARESQASAEADRKRAEDRLVAVEAVTERLKAELMEAREQAMGVSEAAAVSELVRRAEDRAELAEVRAARAEREMAEQAAAITGELRKLTPAEISGLRTNGPAGPAVFAAALRKVALARGRGGKEPMRVALTEVMRAAATWIERL